MPKINTSKSLKNAETSLNILNNLKNEKEKIDQKTNVKEDNASFSGSAFSNLNNSINTFTTIKEYNNTQNSDNINLKTKADNLI